MSVKASPLALEFASEELRNDKQVALMAIIGDVNACQFLGDELKEDEDIKDTIQKY